MPGETLLFDLEANGLLDTATTLHSIQVGPTTGREVTVYCDALTGYPPIEEGLKRLHDADTLIGHNAISYDSPLLDKLHPGTVRRSQIRDTLVMGRLYDPEERQQSLRAWGERLGVSKGDFEGPWDVCTPAMMLYAAKDILVTRALYAKVREVETWGESCDLEHDVAWAIAAQERNGFGFDVAAAERLDAELRGQLEAEKVAVRDVFPPVWVASETRPFVPKRDNKAAGYTAGAALTKVKLQPFNPASRQQVGKRLMGLGWKPKDFGANGSPKVDEAILAGLPYPEAKRLVTFFGLLKRLGQLSDGDNGWLKVVRPSPLGSRIYGRVNPNGACTGRMSHFAPNVAQADKDPAMRALWIPRVGWVMVGCDAEGLEARMLAHYLARYDDGAFADRLLNGRKEDATDIHSANRDAVKAAGFAGVNREGAKTLLYALMYGAGDWKLGTTLQNNLRDQGKPLVRLPAKELGLLLRRALAKSMKGIDKLTEAVRDRAKSAGYIRGLDGRHLIVRSPHAALNTLLQGGGAIVMKRALVGFMDANCIRTEEHGNRWGLCANVHDEVQMEAEPDIAHDLGKAFANCIAAAGAHYQLRCPLAGAYDVGPNWAATH